MLYNTGQPESPFLDPPTPQNSMLVKKNGCESAQFSSLQSGRERRIRLHRNRRQNRALREHVSPTLNWGGAGGRQVHAAKTHVQRCSWPFGHRSCRVALPWSARPRITETDRYAGSSGISATVGLASVVLEDVTPVSSRRCFLLASMFRTDVHPTSNCNLRILPPNGLSTIRLFHDNLTKNTDVHFTAICP